jgi:hypothetical protein
VITRTDADNLKDRPRALRDGFGDSLGLRVHRAISWLQRAAREDDDRDAAFVFLWIAFNSAYSQDIGIAYHVSEKGRFKSFLSTLLSFDRDDRIYHLVWTRFPHEIRLVLENQYVFGPFWNHQNGIEGHQIIHGGSTWSGAINRAQVKDGSEILGSLIPVFVELMMDHPNHPWKEPIYPVIDA